MLTLIAAVLFVIAAILQLVHAHPGMALHLVTAGGCFLAADAIGFQIRKGKQQ